MGADEKPWSEAQWEAFIKRADSRAARFHELLETKFANPDSDLNISREMGWDHDEPDRAATQPADDLAANEADHGTHWRADEEDVSDDDLDDEPVGSIEAYALSMHAAEKIHQALRPLLGGDAEDAEEEIQEAFVQGHIACAKIAGGHGIGYDDRAICGNIVYNRLALNANERCQEALQALVDKGIIAKALLESLMPDLLEARRSIQHRIAELRSRVWW